jgi:N-sulfoglucosamine sulfohydrolase
VYNHPRFLFAGIGTPQQRAVSNKRSVSHQEGTSMRHLFAILFAATLVSSVEAAGPPNILFCISDDQSYAHTGANGDRVIKTPAFDRIAREGIRFTHAFCDAPTCGPSRSAILTGQHIWRLEQAGNIHSTLPAKFATYTEQLQKEGYFVGHTGKGWSPGRDAPGGRTENAAGPAYSRHQYGRGELKDVPQPAGVSRTAYSHNFGDFLSKRPAGKPFCFWLGSYEPHRGYARNLWKAKGRDPAKVVVPPFFPDHPIVRTDILDYCHEIEHFDHHVAEAIALLEKTGELDNTIIVVTSDHGMPFPRAKASLYDAGTHVPLAIRWPAGIKSPGRVYEGLVNLSDVAPTFLQAAQLMPPTMMTAHSLIDIFESPKAETRLNAYTAMERHDGCRKGGKGYPCRAIRTAEYLYIKNYEPGRWPAGDPDRRVCARNIPFGEVDSSPTKQLLMDNADKAGFKRFHDLAFGKRPAEELYDLAKDPGQIVNVATDANYAATRKRLAEALQKRLVATKDPRALGLDAPWDYYPYYGSRRNHDWKVDLRPGATAPVENSIPVARDHQKRIDLQAAVDKFAPGWKVK